MYSCSVICDYSGPEVLFKTCIAMKFVDDDDDDDYVRTVPIIALLQTYSILCMHVTFSA